MRTILEALPVEMWKGTALQAAEKVPNLAATVEERPFCGKSGPVVKERPCCGRAAL